MHEREEEPMDLAEGTKGPKDQRTKRPWDQGTGRLGWFGRLRSFSPLVPARDRARGFALLITVTLLAFMVVLLVGLAAYTRVETSVAGNTQRQALARENALLALDVALGQLQAHAGRDDRVSATAESFGGINGTRFYTGIWSSNTTETAAPGTPLTWLVSGNELRVADPAPDAAAGSTVAAPLAVTPAAPGNRVVRLVGANSAGNTAASFVDAPLVDLTATGIPGVPAAANTAIGRYAWWVGDQGVKAPVAVPDLASAVTAPPYDTADARARLRQQLALGAGAADTSGNPIFEPRDNNNATLVSGQRITAANQFAFLRSSGNAQIGRARVQQNFHTWSPNNFAVLADTVRGGLRQDLSLRPNLLGGAFAAWLDFPTYLEPIGAADPAALAGPAILPAYGDDPLRRRYRITPHQIDSDRGGAHQITPVLSYFLITFNVRTRNQSTAAAPLEVRARWAVSLWNPYTGALVPEDLRMEIAGLPDAVAVNNDTSGVPVGAFSLGEAFGLPLNVSLPWSSVPLPDGVSGEDRRSWLPGRVYTWRSAEDTNGSSAIPASGFASEFYSADLNQSGAGVIRDLNLPAIDGSEDISLAVGNAAPNLQISIFAVRPDGDVLIGRFRSAEFLSTFSTGRQAANQNGYQFGYVFRLAESIDTPSAPGTWLTANGRDPRRSFLDPDAYVVGPPGNDPAQYADYRTVLSPDRLLSRGSGSQSYNEDVPVFELPRAPLLSLGALQHFRFAFRRPFIVGNPWGVDERLNGVRAGELFDRFFFSGAQAGFDPGTAANGDLQLPNPWLRPLRKADASRVTLEEFRATAAAATEETPEGGARSSKFLLQGAAFNLNSVSTAAWIAVLRGVRFPSPQSFTYLNADPATGTAGDDAVATESSTDARFFRFSQSAQETYKAEADSAEPAGDTVSAARTELFRRGMRTLTAAQVAALAGQITTLVRTKQAAADGAGGPFRSLEEFLSPNPLFAGQTTDPEGNVVTGAPRSLLEAAIADAGLNDSIAEFSSQWLTPADLMTALAPTLFARSDTFIVRTYGEAVNPATNAVEGRAWCEATVQRLPEYFEATGDDAAVAPADLAAELNRRYGRRFKVVSFRWLTRSDI